MAVGTFLFSGRSNAKGRNGYFKLSRAKVWGIGADELASIDFYSKREPWSNLGPARLVLNRADLQILHAAIEFALGETP